MTRSKFHLGGNCSGGMSRPVLHRWIDTWPVWYERVSFPVRRVELFADSREYSLGEIEEKERGRRREREIEREYRVFRGTRFQNDTTSIDEHTWDVHLTFLNDDFFLFSFHFAGRALQNRKKKRLFTRALVFLFTVEFDRNYWLINNRWKVKWIGVDLKINVFLSSWFPIQQYRNRRI